MYKVHIYIALTLTLVVTSNAAPRGNADTKDAKLKDLAGASKLRKVNDNDSEASVVVEKDKDQAKREVIRLLAKRYSDALGKDNDQAKLIRLLAKRLLAKRSEAKRVKRGCDWYEILGGPIGWASCAFGKEEAKRYSDALGPKTKDQAEMIGLLAKRLLAKRSEAKRVKRGCEWYEILGGTASCVSGEEEAKRYSDSLGKDKDQAKMIGLLAKRLLAKRSEAKRVKRGCDWYEILGGPIGWASCAFGKEEAKRYSDALGKEED